MPALPYWLFPGDDRPTEEIDDEIAEELQLHLDLLAEEQERRGLAPEEAKQKAAQRFGDFHQLLRRCRREKQGDIPMLKRVQAVLTGLLLASVIYMGWQQWTMATVIAQEQKDIKGGLLNVIHQLNRIAPLPVVDQVPSSPSAPAYSAPTPSYGPGRPQPILGPNGEFFHSESLIPNTEQHAPEEISIVKLTSTGGDLRGSVIDVEGKPIADADVLLILKTWPNNRFRQDDIAIETDKSGMYSVGGLIPVNGQFGINVAAVAEGHAIVSMYLFTKDSGAKPGVEIDLKAPVSETISLQITDSEGKPLTSAVVAPRGRKDTDDNEHIVYHQGSSPAWKKTDEAGVVEVDWFLKGDKATIAVQPKGGEWIEKSFDVTEGDEITIKLDP